ncbi:MAG: DEAD/DEAH box helicase family protein [Roseburia sp.]|nr:DEAD/DEAH box helicase family protein [Roseburia sp.]
MIFNLPNGLFDFQNEAVHKLIDFTVRRDSKQTIVMKSPTGSGKTLILIEYVDEYLRCIDSNTAFIWLCPGKGDLEEQSRKKMQKHCPQRNTQNLFEALLNGFSAGSMTFINWELVTKTGNRAITDGEKKNLFDRIAEAHRSGITFIVIIDEEHSNNTAKANTIINAFSAKNIIRVSATATENKRFEYFEIDEVDVINEGLITEAIYVNEGVADGVEIDDDYNYLLELADQKRKAIAERYKQTVTDKVIRPLVLIQFPNGQPETISAVEKKLESMGYTYDNGMVSKWMSGDKRDLPKNLTENDGIPVFLLMKQAISTGWDCPRAKILVKLREGMSESFEIQTIGRIRRMPEAKHYEDDLLDYCFVYTFDEKYKAGMLSQEDRAWIPRRLFLKDKGKSFTLSKQVQSEQYGSIGDRETLKIIYDYFVGQYRLGKDKMKNKRLLSELGGYIFEDKIVNKFSQGMFVLTESLKDSEQTHSAYKNVDTRNHRIYLLRCLENISSVIKIQRDSVQTILERLFRVRPFSLHKLVDLSQKEFLAFIVNIMKLCLKRILTIAQEKL